VRCCVCQALALEGRKFCDEHRPGTLAYDRAWKAANHDRVVEYQRRLRETGYYKQYNAERRAIHVARLTREGKQCRNCGLPVLAWMPGPGGKRRTRYCSDACFKAARRSTRRTAPWRLGGRGHHRTASFLQVFGRAVIAEYGRRCWVCRRPVQVEITARGPVSRYGFPDKRAASVDHVIPRQLGGSHDLGNLRLAHYGCNLSRSRSRKPEQLPLGAA
jgi:5-methylcytosine-specific restriction endonuclease McrA